MDDDDTVLTPVSQVGDSEVELAVGTIDEDTDPVIISHRLSTEGDWPPPPREPSVPRMPLTRKAAIHRVVKRPDTSS